MSFDSITNLFAAVPTDWIIIGAFAIFAAFDALRSGARRICTLALALPPSALLFVVLPNTVVLGSVAAQFSTPLLEAVLFLIIFAIVYILIGRIGLSWGGEAGQTIQAALAGVAAATIVAVFWLQVPALDTLWHFGPQVQLIFGEAYRFWWLMASYAALAFVRS